MRAWAAYLLLVIGLLSGSFLQAQPDDSLRNINIQALEIRAVVVYTMDSLRGSGTWQPSPWYLQNTAAASPAELLGSNPSIFVKQYAPGGLATLSLRGTGAGHTQVYWNGVPVNSPMLGQGDFALGNASTLGSTRLIYGGASLSEGSGGLGGALEFSSQVQKGIQAFGEYGSFQSWRAAASLGMANSDQNAGIALATNASDNDFPYANVALPGAPVQHQAHAVTRQYSGSGHATRRLGDHNSWLSANAYGQYAQRQLPPTMLTTNLTESQQDYALRGRLAWWVNIAGFGSFNTAVAAIREGLDYQNTQAGIDAASNFTRLHFRTDFLTRFTYKHLRLRGAGLQWMRDQVQSEGLPGGKTRSLGSGYVAFEATRRNFSADLLLREERTDSLWSPLLGYVGLDWAWLTHLRRDGEGRRHATTSHLLANISRNYRLPTLNDLYWSPGGNANLSPEHSLSAELKLDARTPARGDEMLFRYAVSAFANRIDGWVLWTPGSTGIWSPENLGRVWARGAEASLGADFQRGKWQLHLETAYTFTRSTNEIAKSPADSSVGKQLIYTPVHNWRGNLTLERGDWRLSYQQGLTGLRYTSADNADWLPAYTTGDISLAWRHALANKEAENTTGTATRHAIGIRLLASNLWNVQYQTIAWRPMPGRSISLRLQFEW